MKSPLSSAVCLLVLLSGSSLARASQPSAAGASTELLGSLDALAPEQRKAKLIEFETLAHARAHSKAAGSWKVVKDERFCLLTRGDAKNATRVADQAGGVLQWFDKNLSWYAPEAYVRRPVLAIYKDVEDFYAARPSAASGKSAKDWNEDDWSLYIGATQIEITTYDAKGGIEGAGGPLLNGEMARYWLQEHDRATAFALPGWLSNGLEEVARTMSFKRGKVSVTVDDYERDGVHALLRIEKPLRVRDLLSKVYVDDDKDWNLRYGRKGRAAILIRLLTSGPGAKHARFKDMLPNYFASVAEAARGLQTEVAQAANKGAQGAPDSPPPTTEDEEIAYFRRLHKAWRDAEQRVLDAAFERTFRGWTDADWKALQALYDKELDAL